MPDLRAETWEHVDNRVRAIHNKLEEIDRYRRARTYAPLHAAVEKLGAWADELAEEIINDILGQIDKKMKMRPLSPVPSGDPPQVALSDAQLGVLQYVHDADIPVETGPHSNFAAGWVSGSVAAALVSKSLMRYVGTGRVEVTAAGCVVLAQYSR